MPISHPRCVSALLRDAEKGALTEDQRIAFDQGEGPSILGIPGSRGTTVRFGVDTQQDTPDTGIKTTICDITSNAPVVLELIPCRDSAPTGMSRPPVTPCRPAAAFPSFHLDEDDDVHGSPESPLLRHESITSPVERAPSAYLVRSPVHADPELLSDIDMEQMGGGPVHFG
ncbi:hypothetical protein KIPB_013492 [Kipferlia bialata]|uniref:Uncharacterized protein n=1 Tax=Kipferlia bialata TaxID=797122 RepID=A0A9K3GPP4_9EUKA|nr:hypothetical protein KIPB_013492 [Kipferlia bialata]|eukprot:g13492.t1